MLHYSAAKLGRQAGRKPGTTAILSPVPISVAAEKQILAALRAMLSGVVDEVRTGIIPLYQADLAQRQAEVRISIDSKPNREWFRRLANIVVTLQRTATDTVERILGLEAQRHTDGFLNIFRKAVGIDIGAVVQKSDLTDAIEAAVARNASLIKSLGDEAVRRVEQTVIENGLAGNSVKTLRSALKTQFGFTDRRAKIIARDQMGKFHADLDELRQQQAGISEYDWATSHDERVRPLHHDLDTNRYLWGKPTGAEGGLPPGKPILCRCRARAVIVF